MSNFPEPNSPAFVPVYQLKRTDAVDAGAAGDGPSNLPIKDLVERTAYLKKEVEDLDSALGGVVIGSTVQAYDADLAAIAALTTTGAIARTGAGTATTHATGTAGLAVLAAADAAAARTAIGSPAFAGDSTATITTNSVVRSQIDASGNVSSTIPGGSALLPEFKCRAWVNFDGTTATPSTIRGSGNVSSVTKNATADYTINFTTAMPDTNYSFYGCANGVAPNKIPCLVGQDIASIKTISALQIVVLYNNAADVSLVDVTQINVAVFR